jgi:hypothetical protein
MHGYNVVNNIITRKDSGDHQARKGNKARGT